MNLRDLLLPYQRAFVEDRRPFKIWLSCRQAGKSTAVSLEAVELCADAPRTAVLIVSSSGRQSAEVLEKAKIWAEAIGLAVGPEVVTRNTSEELRFENGSRILSLPANPNTIRGFSGHVFLDEFAFHDDSRRIWAAVYPIATRGYLLRVTSTANGKQNMFYQAYANGGDYWSRHFTDIHMAVDQGLPVNVELLRQGCPDPETWAQEYECRFVDEATAFLTYEMIASVESPEAGLANLAQSGPFFIGADIGRRRDLTVYWVLEQVGDVLWTREMKVLSKASFAEQDRELDDLFDRYNPRRICMDQSGLGEKNGRGCQKPVRPVSRRGRHLHPDRQAGPGPGPPPPGRGPDHPDPLCQGNPGRSAQRQ